jgi:hypothetical protein
MAKSLRGRVRVNKDRGRGGETGKHVARKKKLILTRNHHMEPEQMVGICGIGDSSSQSASEAVTA